MLWLKHIKNLNFSAIPWFLFFCLLLDPMKTTNGAVGLKAYRLKSKFFKNYGDSEITNET